LHFVAWIFYIYYRLYEKSYLPLLLMLYFYGLVAGILLYRVPMYGDDVLHQTRYVRSYLVGLWGLLWAILAIYRHRVGMINPLVKYFLAIFLALLFILQIGLILFSWKESEKVIAHQESNYKKILFYVDSASSGVKKDPCLKAHFGMCSVKSDQRQRVLLFLQEKELNLFSSKILSRRSDWYLSHSESVGY
jgi:hypothetical protein